MAWYLLVLLGLALLIGLLFEKNTFCAHVCPVGHLLGLYARIAPFGWGVKNADVCKSCTDKSCVAKKNIYQFQAKSCGVNLSPFNLDDNTNCLLCGQCLKACEKYNPGQDGRPNLGWFRRPWGSDLLNLHSLNSAQTMFLMIVSGFVVYEVLTEWDVAKAILLWAPQSIESALFPDGTVFSGIIKSVLLFFILPLIFWMIPFLLSRLVGSKIKAGQYFKTVVLAFIPLMASAHVVKALLKMTSRLPYISASLNDPVGIKTTQAIIDGAMVLKTLPSFVSVILTVTSLLLLIIGIILSFKILFRAASFYDMKAQHAVPLFLIPVLYGGLFLFVLIAWRVF